MRDFILVFLGGGLGSITRFGLGKWVNSFHSNPFPFGTLVVNIVACLILGVVVGLADQKQVLSASSRIFWTIGFCGGFSTFSTFSIETLSLLQNGLTSNAIAYVAASLVLCVGATFLGIYAGGVTA